MPDQTSASPASETSLSQSNSQSSANTSKSSSVGSNQSVLSGQRGPGSSTETKKTTGAVNRLESNNAEEKNAEASKGLSANAVGVFAAIIIGVSCVAPAYSLTGALGPVASGVKTYVPAIFILAFIPMLLTAFSYRELNSTMPDSGTSFTWTVRAFGPQIGWLVGWGLICSTVMVVASLASVAVDFFYKAIGQVLGQSWITELTNKRLINIVTCLIFIAIASYIAWRGMETTKLFQYLLVIFQVVVLVGFGAIMLFKVSNGSSPSPVSFSLDWFNPFEAITQNGIGAVAVAVSVTVFIFWGWDVVLTMSEETEGANKTPGVAATLSILITVALYTFVSIATILYAGVGETEYGLGNPKMQDNVFFSLSDHVMGPFSILISFAILASSAASLQSTLVSPARTLLAMGFYRAIPKRFSKVHPYYFTPSYATAVSGIGAGIFYTVTKLLSENVLWDTVNTMGIFVCFYYGMTSLSCLWYYRKEWTRTVRDFFMKLLLPALGVILMAALFVGTIVQSFDPANGSGSEVGGVGLVFILAMLLFLVGIVLEILVARTSAKKFFKGERFLKKGQPGDGFQGDEELITPEAMDGSITI